VVAASAGALFMLMAWGEWSGLLHHHFVPALPHGETGWKADAAHNTFYVAGVTSLQSALFFFVAYTVSTLVERARFQERRLEALAEEARAERRLLEQALETTGTALRVTNPNLQPRWINAQWREWFGSGDPDASPRGQGTDRFTNPLVAAHERASAADTGMESLQVTELALAFLPDDGPGHARGRRHDRVFRITTAPLINRDGTVGDVVDLAQEITQQKQAEAHMMRAAKLAAVGELAGNVAHEVNNPIAIISAKARLLLADHRNGMSAKTAEEIGKIVDLADRVARIAQGLLSYCRPSPARRVPLDIRVPIRKALSMIEQRARSSGVHVEDRLGHSMPPVRANASEIEEVFLNLFLNALDAMPAGGGLSISTASPDNGPSPVPCVEVAVEDTGIGIADEIRGEIFEPFLSTKEEGRGTGLGLSICLGIIRSHGGTIDVDSAPGQGTRFAVRLPIAVSDHAAETRHG
jgi:signal transduction histidine kinase